MVRNSQSRPDFYFWRDNTGNEIDLIIDEGRKQKAIEIKSSRVINTDFFKGLEYWSKLTGAPAEDLFLIYGDIENQTRSKGMVAGWQTASAAIFPL